MITSFPSIGRPLVAGSFLRCLILLLACGASPCVCACYLFVCTCYTWGAEQESAGAESQDIRGKSTEGYSIEGYRGRLSATTHRLMLAAQQSPLEPPPRLLAIGSDRGGHIPMVDSEANSETEVNSEANISESKSNAAISGRSISASAFISSGRESNALGDEVRGNLGEFRASLSGSGATTFGVTAIGGELESGEAKPAGAWALLPEASPEAIHQSITRGVAFLLARQNPNGSWGSARNTKGLNIYAPVPGAHHGFRAAVTGLCVAALVESKDRSAEVLQAIRRAEEWFEKELPEVRRATPDAIYNVWGHAFAIQALVRLLELRKGEPERVEQLRELLTQQVDLLRRYEAADGGWCYYDFRIGTQHPAGNSNCFVAATALVALHEAQAAGIEVPRQLVDRAIASIHRQRKPDFSYYYSESFRFYPMALINRPGGSLGRSQACNFALRIWGDSAVTDQVLEDWLTRLVLRNGWLDMGRKRPIPHESWFAVAGYFFYYGHYYAARCIELLPAEKRPRYQKQLAGILIRLQERDGSWWDYPLYDYHQQYGTAFALMSLIRCLPE